MKNYPAQNPVERKLTPQLQTIADSYDDPAGAHRRLSNFLTRLKNSIDTRNLDEWQLVKSIVERLTEEETGMRQKRDVHGIKHKIYMLEFHLLELEEVFRNALKEGRIRMCETLPAPEEPSPKKIIQKSREAMHKEDLPVNDRKWREPTPQELDQIEKEFGTLPSDEELMSDLEKEFGI